MFKLYKWLAYYIVMSHKKFQHFINWFGIFIRAKTNMQKKKGKIKQKIKEKDLPVAQAEPAQPAHPAHQGHGGLLPRPAHPSCSVECHRASRGRHVAAERLPGRPVPSSRIQETSRSRPSSFPPPRRPPLPLSPDSSPPEKHAGAPSSPRVAIDVEKPPEPVHRLHRRLLRRAVQGIEPGDRVDAGFFLEFTPATVKNFVNSVAVEPPQPSPPPLLASW